jgi:hypothetical protein
MFQRIDIRSPTLSLTKADAQALSFHCRRVIQACEKDLASDFSEAVCALTLKKTAPPYAWSYGDAFLFHDRKVVRVSLYAPSASFFLTAPFAACWLNQTLVHEWHHAARTLQGEYGGPRLIGETLVSEGLALRYQEEFTGLRPWLRWPAAPRRFPSSTFYPLPPATLRDVALRLHGELTSPETTDTPDLRLFGAKGNALYPPQCGYAFGDWLIGHYLHAKATTARDAVGVSGQAVLDWYRAHHAELIPSPLRRPPAAAYVYG